MTSLTLVWALQSFQACSRLPVVLLNSSHSLRAAVRSDVSSGPKGWYRRSAIIFSFSDAIPATQ